MKTRLLLIALLASLTSFGQGWEQTYGFTDLDFPTGRSVQQTSDGGYIIACDSYDYSESLRKAVWNGWRSGYRNYKRRPYEGL